MPALVRARSILLLVLAGLWAAIMLVVLVAGLTLGGFNPRVLPLVALLAVPGALAWLALRRLRHPPTLDPVALTVTAEHVVFEARQSPGLLMRTRPRAQWDRSATTTSVLPAGWGMPPRLELRSTTAPRDRRHRFAVDFLDTPVETITAAIRRP